MKMLPILLINVALVGGGIVIYDQLRGDAPHATYDTVSADNVQLSDLASRLARLEENAGAPMLRASGGDGLAKRIEMLEQRLADGPPPPRGDAPASADGEERPPLARPEIPVGDGEDAQAADEELRWFRRMRDADDLARREEREREQLTRMLASLEISLNPEQTDKLLVAQRDMRTKMGEIWRGVPRGPDVDREQLRQEMGQKMETIRDEYAVTINKFIPAGDAAKIVESSNRMGRGFMADGAVSAPGASPGRRGR